MNGSQTTTSAKGLLLAIALAFSLTATLRAQPDLSSPPSALRSTLQFEAFLAGAAWCGSGKALSVRAESAPASTATWSPQKGAYTILVGGKPASIKAQRLSIDTRTLSVCLPAGAPPLVTIQGPDSLGRVIEFSTADLELTR